MIVKDKHLAEDLFQDTFLKVINSLRTGCYKDKGKFLPWVLRIAHNIIMDHFRLAKRIPYLHSIENREVFNLIHIMDYPIEDKMIVEQILKNVKDLLEYLPPAQKEVIVMYHYYEMNFREISEDLGISINTVLGRMRYGLEKMRDIINQKQMIMSP
jgi:RNA polymerase sigma factor (sigma-70 family)